jgi:hypothetical protein
MLNIVTVHWQSPKWIDPQLAYLARHVDVPYRVFASLNGIDDQHLRDRFHYAADLDGTHAEKLNALAITAIGQSEPDDLLVFLDGDAFPVRPVGRWMDEVLGSYPLAAVRRDENLGDVQPHPCFTFTTCRFWAELGGDWREGGTWTAATGAETTDVGGNLLHQLEAGGHDWLPILRTNVHNPEPLCFGVYGHRVYHHGAGFRPPVTRVGAHDAAASAGSAAEAAWGTSLEGLARRVVHRPSLATTLRPGDLPRLGRAARVSVGKQSRRWHERQRLRGLATTERRQEAVFERLTHDPRFFTAFDDTAP